MATITIKADGIYYATDQKIPYLLLDGELRTIGSDLIDYLVGKPATGDTNDYSQSNPFVSTNPPFPISSLQQLNTDANGTLIDSVTFGQNGPLLPGLYWQMAFGWNTPANDHETPTIRLISSDQINFLGIRTMPGKVSTTDVEAPISIFSNTNYKIEQMNVLVWVLQRVYVQGMSYSSIQYGVMYWKPWIEKNFTSGNYLLALPEFDVKTPGSGNNANFIFALSSWKNFFTAYKSALPVVVSDFTGTTDYLSCDATQDDYTTPWSGQLSTWINIETLPAEGKVMQIMGAWDINAANGRSYMINLMNNGGVYTLRFLISTDGTAATQQEVSINLPENVRRKWLFVEAWQQGEQISMRLNNDSSTQQTTQVGGNSTPYLDNKVPFVIGSRPYGKLASNHVIFDGRVGCTLMTVIPGDGTMASLVSLAMYNGGGAQAQEMKLQLPLSGIPALICTDPVLQYIAYGWFLNEQSGTRTQMIPKSDGINYDLEPIKTVGYSHY